ncbi:MAG: leucine--tRNA ligase [Nitrososphaeraceae archaeon]
MINEQTKQSNISTKISNHNNIVIDWNDIEKRWKSKWDSSKLFETNVDKNKHKYFITVAFPYPNSPQHIGHGRTYTLADAHARYLRMKGNNVLFPMGFHYTGTPILAMSRRVNEGDTNLIDTFKNVYKLSDDVIESFSEAKQIAKYFHNEIKLGMKDMGYSIDWRREFTTIDKLYSKFIIWQFTTLRNKNLIIQGSHPVGWCPNDRNPVSQHDTLGDVEPEFNEYTLIKFRLENKVIIPTATLRPETIFGVTNLWINPQITYVQISIDDEKWIVSKEAAKKLEFLDHNITIESNIQGKDLIGQIVTNPQTNNRTLIYPGYFVKSDTGTGIVMSVPAHAPYDYQALKDLKNNIKLLQTYNLDPNITPIKIIDVDNNSTHVNNPDSLSSLNVIKKFNITNQNDSLLEKATNELYLHEYYNGYMSKNTGIYSGMSVKDAKEKIKNNIITKQQGEIFYELIKPVKCRCGSECFVKLLTDQWFINYGDKEWKQQVHHYLDNGLKILPTEIKQEFHNVTDWLKERACARKSGLGTTLPWDHNWIIESLSDSSIYMVYYILSKFVNNDSLNSKNIENIENSFFDYVIFGIGRVNEISKKIGAPSSLIHDIRNEFLYFYPVDSRHSGRDLIPNHLSFFIFNHIAIFESKFWPKQIVVNGSVMMEGKKMSKSIGNIIPLRQAISNYGADTIRLSILISAELLQDADFSFTIAKSIRSKLSDIYSFSIFFQNHLKSLEFHDSNILTDLESSLYLYISENCTLNLEDNWLISKLQNSILEINFLLDNLRIRDIIHKILYVFDQDIQLYKKFVDSMQYDKKQYKTSNTILLLYFIIRIKIISIFAPFICEEIWHKFGNKDFIINSPWPSIHEDKIDPLAIESENFIINLVNDINKIIKVTKKSFTKIYVYCSNNQKKLIYKKILTTIAIKKEKNFSNIMKLIISDQETYFARKDPNLIKKIVDDILSDSSESQNNRLKINEFNEINIINYFTKFILSETHSSAKLVIFSDNDLNKYDPKFRSKFSRPFKPAIYLE